jgi:hypothetical protein
MKNFGRKQTVRSITVALCLCGALCSIETVMSAQSGTAQNSCNAVHEAYNKTFSAGANMSTKNSGAVNVTQAQGEITQAVPYQESCKYLRDETLNGEATSVYSDLMKSRAGTADGKVWISKSKGLILQQDVEVDMGAKGKGKQTILFTYKK